MEGCTARTRSRENVITAALHICVEFIPGRANADGHVKPNSEVWLRFLYLGEWVRSSRTLDFDGNGGQLVLQRAGCLMVYQAFPEFVPCARRLG